MPLLTRPSDTVPGPAGDAASALAGADTASAELDLPVEEREALLDLARAAVRVAVGKLPMWALRGTVVRAAPDRRGAAFVTLTADGLLRGCMGSLDTRRPLGEAVADAALCAALDDPRFEPLGVSELPAIHIDVSVLAPARPYRGAGDFTAGLDGVTIEGLGHRALLLPEVATEFDWGADEMFEAVRRKAGLPADAWLRPEVRLATFRTCRFGGMALPGTEASAHGRTRRSR